MFRDIKLVLTENGFNFSATSTTQMSVVLPIVQGILGGAIYVITYWLFICALNKFRVLCPCVIIDTAVWIDEKQDFLFAVLTATCRLYHKQLVVYNPQFEQTSCSRIGACRMVELRQEGLLAIEPLDDKTASKGFIGFIIQQAQLGKQCCFVSDNALVIQQTIEVLSNVLPNRFVVDSGYNDFTLVVIVP